MKLTLRAEGRDNHMELPDDLEVLDNVRILVRDEDKVELVHG